MAGAPRETHPAFYTTPLGARVYAAQRFTTRAFPNNSQRPSFWAITVGSVLLWNSQHPNISLRLNVCALHDSHPGSSPFPTVNPPLFLSSPLGFPCPRAVSALKVTLLWRENSLIHSPHPPNLVLFKMRFEKPKSHSGPLGIPSDRRRAQSVCEVVGGEAGILMTVSP